MTGALAFDPGIDAATHFRLAVFGAVLHLAEQRGATAEAPALVADYRAEAARLAGRGEPPSAREWAAALDAADARLPFARLALAGFAPLARQLLAAVAMVDEDPALAGLIEPGGGRPTLGGLVAGWRGTAAGDRAGEVRAAVLDLDAAGLLEQVDAEVLRGDCRLRVPGPLLDVLAGAPPRLEGARFEPCATLPRPGEWTPPRDGAADPARLGALIAGDPMQLVVARGPGRNGRRLLLRAAARVAGRDVLTVPQAMLIDGARWKVTGALAALAGAMIVAEVAPAPGETLAIPAHPLFAGPIGVAIGASGAVRGEGALSLVHVALPLPDPTARARQWRAHGHADGVETLALTLGNIARAARGAAAAAALAGRPGRPLPADVRAAASALRDARLDALATPLDQQRAPEPLFLDPRESDEFETLLLRARHRERLAAELGQGRGVRALFAGPSGTGKTLAARHIAARLDKDLYRIDLAATVSKYIGETEKCLDRALAAAEELDVVLLLDEGDALMARRTDVGSANDRYANLETNFLLQRIETFEGIILVTTNDAERIDQAFARRLDAILTFRSPDAVTRRAMLSRQLGARTVSARLLDDIACRCQLTGGQLSNVAIHARLLAMERTGDEPDDACLRAAIEREYRKIGAFCPLKPELAAAG